MRNSTSPYGSSVLEDYAKAQRIATLGRIWANLTGKNNSLVPFADLKKALGLVAQRYRGVEAVPLDKIIGSFGRSNDFDRAFAPTQRHSRRKWLSVDSAYSRGITLPPVSLYKIGDAYFVVDGHHRVSVARQKGQAFIDAEVTEVDTRVPATAEITVKDLDRLAACRKFLEKTGLDKLRPNADACLALTMPGDYARLLDHIRMHKYFVETEQSHELRWEEAVAHWYDHVFYPLVETIRQYQLLKDFPGHTEGDLYLWIIEHAYYLSQRLGRELDPWEAARDFVHRFSRRPKRIWNRAVQYVRRTLVPAQLGAGPPAGVWREDRVEVSDREHLFRDILVTLTGAPSSWLALSQAAEFARREEGTLRGLYVANPADEDATAYGHRILEEFSFRCEGLGVKHSTTLALGNVQEEIVERSRWVDMIAINQRKVHGRWAERPLGTLFQTVASQAVCPILAVPGTQVAPMERVVLAYDGSPKAREALFVLRHLLTCWQVEGAILTVRDGATGRELLDLAVRYIEESGGPTVIARYEPGPSAETILRVMEEMEADLLLMGGYGYQPLIKALLGSAIDPVLREAWFPVLICR